MHEKRVKLEGRQVVHEGERNLSRVEFTDTEVSALWRCRMTYKFVYDTTDAAKTAELVKLRNEYMGTALGPDESIVAFMEDMGSFLDDFTGEFDVIKSLHYVIWYLNHDFECTYPVLVTRTAYESWLESTKGGGFGFDRFEFKKE